MTTETEELLWVATQEYKLIPKSVILFAIKNKKTLYELLTINPSDLKGVDEKDIEKFLENREEIPFESYQVVYELMQKDRVSLITYCDPYFPEFLKRNERNLPILLYHQGKKIKFENGVAVVGTRNCSTHAVEISRGLGRELSSIGYTIVSGLARGIDASAHRGAVSVNGKTIAVLPWMHEPYPPEHERLLLEIMNQGCVISENFTQKKRIDKFKFLERNAIISAISNVLIAVESMYSGGTRWQVELALSQGKTVIVIEPELKNEQAYDGFKKFVYKGAIKASTISEAVDIVKQKAPIRASLDNFDVEEEIQLPPLRRI